MVWYPYKSKHIVQNWNSNLTFSEFHLFIYIYIYIYIYYRHKKIGKCCTHFQNMYNICNFFCVYNVSLLCKYNINIQRSLKNKQKQKQAQTKLVYLKKKRQLTKLTKPKTLFMSLLALFIYLIEIAI